jgi:hypothetical protein
MDKCEEKNYSCEATVTITGDQIMIDLNTDFGFPEGTEIELADPDKAKKNGSSTVLTVTKAGHSVINGHAIING